MTDLDPAVIASISTKPYRGDGFRQQAPKYDPLSGEGARRRGGRFNPPQSFPVLYLCTTRACTVAEFLRAGSRLAIGPEGLLPRQVFKYDVGVDLVLDLTDDSTLEQLGLAVANLVGDDLSLTRSVGEAAHALGIQAIQSRSATEQDHVLSVFLENLGLGTLVPALEEMWETIDDL
ncbi:MAG: RES family NAD+ phosphorylase [Actinomycetota bacterium]